MMGNKYLVALIILLIPYAQATAYSCKNRGVVNPLIPIIKDKHKIGMSTYRNNRYSYDFIAVPNLKLLSDSIAMGSSNVKIGSNLANILDTNQINIASVGMTNELQPLIISNSLAFLDYNASTISYWEKHSSIINTTYPKIINIYDRFEPTSINYRIINNTLPASAVTANIYNIDGSNTSPMPLTATLQNLTSSDRFETGLRHIAPVINAQAIAVQQQNKTLITSRINKLNLGNYHNADDDDADYGVWFRPFFEDAKQNNNSAMRGYKVHMTGVIAGIDREIGPRGSLGVAASYAYSVTKSINYTKTATDIKTYLGTLYGTYKFTDSISLDLIGSAGNNYYNGSKLHDVKSMYTASSADYLSQQYSGTAILRKNLLRRNVVVTPEISASYTYLRQHGYSEKYEEPLGYTVGSNHPNVFTIGCGAEVSSPQRNKLHKFLPQAKAGIYYDLKAATQNATTSAITGAPALPTAEAPGRLTGQVGAGLLYRIDDRLSFDMNYNLFVKNKYYNNGFYLNVSYWFN